MVLEPPAPVRSPIVHFLTRYNPFYLLSACSMLFGVFAMNGSLDWDPSAVSVGRLVLLIVTLNVYEMLLIALAVFLLRRGIRRDGMMLMLIEAFFLVDVGFLNMEVFARDVWVGLLVNTLVLAAAGLKAAILFRAAGIGLTDGKFAFTLMQLGVLFAAPGIFAIVAASRDQKLPMLALYGGWWLCGLLPVAYAQLVGNVNVFLPRSDGRWAGMERIMSRVLLALPMLSLIAHLSLAHWVYKVPFHPLHLAPLLLGLAVVAGSCTRHVLPLDLRVQAQLALPLVAIAVSAVNAPAEMIFRLWPGAAPMFAGVSPLRLILFAAAMVYLEGLWRFRHAYFGFAAAGCLMLGGMGHSVGSINDNSVHLAKASSHALHRLVPKTLFAWGLVSVIASFVLLALGAMTSMIRRDRGPIAFEDLGDVDERG